MFSGQPYLATGERFIIEDLGIHILDIARFLFGDVDPPDRAHPRGSIRRSAARTSRRCCSTTRAARPRSSTAATPRGWRREPFPETLVEVDGSAGTIRLGQGYRMVVTGRDGSETLDVSPPLLPWASRPWHNIQESVAAIQQHWVDCLREGREPETSGRDNLRTLALVEAAYRSAGTGRTIELAADAAE